MLFRIYDTQTSQLNMTYSASIFVLSKPVD